MARLIPRIAKVSEALGAQIDSPEFIRGSNSETIFDLRSGLITTSSTSHQARGKVLELLEVLSRDFYKPQKITSLFSELFQNEYFDVNTSSDRVHQIIRRSRRWLSAEKLPFQIHSHQGNFKLELNGGRILVPYERSSVDLTSQRLRMLHRVLPKHEISL